MLYAVPRSLFINDHVVRSDQEGVHETLRQSLIFWKQIISGLLTKVWRLLNEDNLLKKVMKDAKIETCSSGIALESHLNKRCSESKYRLHPTRLVAAEDAYLQGVISWETYGTYRNASLPKEILATKKDPFSFEDKKLLLGIKPEPIKPPEPISDKVDGGVGGATDENGTKAKNCPVDNGSKQ